MGIYDRDYYRDDWKPAGNRRLRKGFFSSLTVVGWIVLINVALYLLNGLLCPESNILTALLSMHGFTLKEPLFWYQTLTYGFVQDPSNFMHIFGNMFTLFFLGPPVERRYGGREFLLFYLLAVVVGGLVWGIANYGEPDAMMLGASGAVSAVVILFAINYPHMMLFVYGIIPVPAWLLGILYIVLDSFGYISGGSNIAHEVHLAGAAFALLYFFSRIRLTSIFSRIKFPKRGPRVKRDQYQVRSTGTISSQLEKEVDRILRKISLTGEESLTEQERETLRRASREYQKRKDRF